MPVRARTWSRRAAMRCAASAAARAWSASWLPKRAFCAAVAAAPPATRSSSARRASLAASWPASRATCHACGARQAHGPSPLASHAQPFRCTSPSYDAPLVEATPLALPLPASRYRCTSH